MTDMNFVGLIGRLVRDGELSYTPGGTPILKLSMAVNKRMKKKDGSWADQASFFDCNLWGKYGESMVQYCTKGKQVAIQGELEQQRWTDKNTGKNMSRILITVRQLQLLSGPKEGGNSGHNSHNGNNGNNDYEQDDPPQGEMFEDDIPF